MRANGALSASGRYRGARVTANEIAPSLQAAGSIAATLTGTTVRTSATASDACGASAERGCGGGPVQLTSFAVRGTTQAEISAVSSPAHARLTTFTSMTRSPTTGSHRITLGAVMSGNPG